MDICSVLNSGCCLVKRGTKCWIISRGFPIRESEILPGYGQVCPTRAKSIQMLIWFNTKLNLIKKGLFGLKDNQIHAVFAMGAVFKVASHEIYCREPILIGLHKMGSSQIFKGSPINIFFQHGHIIKDYFKSKIFLSIWQTAIPADRIWSPQYFFFQTLPNMTTLV